MKTKPLVVVTGASSGIGEATAKTLSEMGHPLLLLARRLDRLEALKLPHSLCRKVDVTDSPSLNKAIAEAEKEFGPVDCLVNNAGVMLLGEVATQDPKEWMKMYEVNILGLLNGIKAVLPGMIERKRGTVINISSVAGRKTFPNHAVYCGTKFGVHAISENLREEVAKHNVRVITIAPGAVQTELLGHTTSDEIKQNYESWKDTMGGALDPEDVARSVAFVYQQPQSVCLREIVLAATRQEP